MAAKNPVEALQGGDHDLQGSKALADFKHELMGQIESDWLASQQIRSKWAYFKARRHGLLGRNPQTPWPGSSNIIMPLIDKTIGQIAPLYDTLTFGRGRIIEGVPLNAESADRADSVEDYINSIFRGYSQKFAMPDFQAQHKMVVQNLLNYGRGIWRTGHSYKTRSEWKTLHRESLPGILSMLAVAPNLKMEERAAIQADWQQRGLMEQFNPPAVVQAFGEPVNPMNKEVFDKHAKAIRDMVVEGFGLDAKQPVDREARDEIVRWLRSGARQMSKAVKVHMVVENTPRAWSVQPNHLIVPDSASFDLQLSPRIVQRRFFHGEEALRSHAQDNGWYEDVIDTVLEQGESRTWNKYHDDLEDAEESARLEHDLTTSRKDMFEVHDAWFWKDVDGDGKAELINMVFDPASGVSLKERESPYDHNQMPFCPVYFEMLSPFYAASRGVPEIINDQDKYVTSAKRQADNSRFIQTSTGVYYRPQPGLNEKSFKWGRPNLNIPVQNPTRDIQPIQLPVNSVVWDEEAFFQANWVEGHIGVSRGGTASNPRLERPITKAENVLDQGDRRQVMGDRASTFQIGMHLMYRQIASVAMQYAPAVFYTQVTKQNPVEMRRSQIAGDFDVFPVGTVNDMDPGFRLSKATQAANTLLGAAQHIESSPAYVPNYGKAIKMVLDEIDPIMSDQLLFRRSNSELKQIMDEEKQREAQAQELSAKAQAARANTPQDPEAYQELLEEIRKTMPHKDLQRIEARGAAATASRRQAEALVNAGGQV